MRSLTLDSWEPELIKVRNHHQVQPWHHCTKVNAADWRPAACDRVLAPSSWCASWETRSSTGSTRRALMRSPSRSRSPPVPGDNQRLAFTWHASMRDVKYVVKILCIGQYFLPGVIRRKYSIWTDFTFYLGHECTLIILWLSEWSSRKYNLENGLNDGEIIINKAEQFKWGWTFWKIANICYFVSNKCIYNLYILFMNLAESFV